MTQLLEAKAVAAQIRAEVAAGAREVEARAGRPPGLAVVLVGDDPASRVYVGSKTRACAEAGLASFGHLLPATTPASELLALLDQLNADPQVDGILVQMPLPAGLPARDILDRVDPEKDVDGFHPVNVGRLWLDQAGFVPCTPAGIIESLHRHGIALAGKHAVVVGRSSIVGKPMAGLLLRENCTVTIAHSKSRDLAAICREADLLVAAVGRPGMITAAHVREGAVVVDVGINRVQDARELAQGAVEVSHVAQPERHRRGVEAPVGKGESERIGVEDRRPRAGAGSANRAIGGRGGRGGRGGLELGRRERQHRQAKVGGDDFDPGATQRQSLVAGAAAEVEDPRARGEDQRPGELAPPDPVEGGREQVVQEVVAAGDPAEHRPDPCGVLLLQLLDCDRLCKDFRPGFRHDGREVYRGGEPRSKRGRFGSARPVRRLDSLPGDLYDFRLSALKCRIRSSPADPQNRFLR